MATGYTSCIGDGAAFEEFVLGCARAIDYLATMRDEPSGAAIPDEFHPSPYYFERRVELNERLAQLKSMTTREAEAAARREAEERKACRAKSARDNGRLRQLYEKMLERVRNWAPPTSEHQGLKDFMVQQIEQSVAWDCRPDDNEPVLARTAAQWLSEELEDCRNDIARNEKHLAEEVERARARTAWVQALKKSL
jgi:hypothetical protein